MSVRIETLWAQAGFSPNQQQRDAILHIEGPLFLTAGPGSGKTRVLLWRTLNLIVFHGVPVARRTEQLLYPCRPQPGNGFGRTSRNRFRAANAIMLPG